MTAMAAMARPLPRVPALTRAGLIPLFAAAAWVLSRDVLRGQLLLPMLCAAVPLTLLLLKKTQEAALLWLLLVATVLPARLVPVSVAGVRTDAAELLGLALVGAVITRALFGERFRRTAFTGPLVAFVGAAFAGAVVAAGHDAPRATWLGLLKTFLLYLVPLAFCWLFATDAHRDLLERWIHRLCTVGGVLVLLSAATGRGVPEGEVPEVVTLGVASDALRLRPALLTLIVLATLLLAARTSVTGLRTPDLARFAVYGTVVAASFTRSTWVPLVLSLALLAVLRPGPRVALRGLRSLLVLVLIAAALFPLATSGALGDTAQAVTVRVRSIGSDRVLTENSYLDRKIEIDQARQAISRSPITGVGLGQPYGAVRRVYDPTTKVRTTSDRRFIHNSFLGVWLWTGVLGLLALLWLSIRITAESARAAVRLPAREGARAVAAGLAVLALGVQSTFQTSLTNRSVIATVACALALLYVPRAEEA
jgi:O-antigen ligase